MKKLNDKGYMLIEVILSFALAFAIVYFLLSIVIKLKTKNDDLMVETLTTIDKTIISNKLMGYMQSEAASFDCEKIGITTDNIITYDDNFIIKLNNYAIIGEGASCDNDDNKISINIPVIVSTLPDTDFSVELDYYYGVVDICSFNHFELPSGNIYTVNDVAYDCIDDDACELIDEGNGKWNIRLYKSGIFNISTDTCVDIALVGGGGGGGGRRYNNVSNYSNYAATNGGGGGGGGSVVNTFDVALSSDLTYTVTVGTGGIRGERNNDGSDGENTTFVNADSSLNLLAPGGGGGKFSPGVKLPGVGGISTSGGAGGQGAVFYCSGENWEKVSDATSDATIGENGKYLFNDSTFDGKMYGAGGGGGGGSFAKHKNSSSSGKTGGIDGGGVGAGCLTTECRKLTKATAGVDGTGSGGGGACQVHIYSGGSYGSSESDGDGGNGGTGIAVIRSHR